MTEIECSAAAPREQMNDTVRCPSNSHRRNALAHGQICPVCEPDAVWAVRCPTCRLTVPAQGTVVLPHTVGGAWLAEDVQDCAGAGSTVQPPPLPDRPIWRSGMPRVRSAA